MIEKWKKALDKSGFAAGVLMGLSEAAFDTINHELLFAKMHAFGFHESSLKILLDYLTNRWQRTKVFNKYSS